MTPAKPAWWHRDGGRLIIVFSPTGPGGGRDIRHVPAPVPRAKAGPKLAAALAANLRPQPRRISMALDLYGLDGPEVDEALGVTEPAVDRWEAGTLEPTTDQVRRLATLTGFAPAWFYDEAPAPVTGAFICGRGKGFRSGWHEFPDPPPAAQRQLILDTAVPDDYDDAHLLVDPSLAGPAAGR